MQRKKPTIFYGWFIVAIIATTMLVAFALRFSFTVFYVAILDEFGWTRAGTAGIFSLSLLVYALSTVPAGALIDRFGPRKIMPLGAILVALGGMACSQANTIWHFYLSYGVFMALGVCLLGFVPSITIISNWFVRRRGTAIGIAMVGAGLSSLFVPLVQYLISTVGWRVAFMIPSAAVFVIVVPLTAIFHRHRPQDMGLLPDGATPAEGEKPDSMASEDGEDHSLVDKGWASTEWTLPQALKTYRLWLLLFMSIPLSIVVTFPVVHQVAYLVNAGYSAMFAALIFALFGILNSLGRAGGFISDRLGRERTYTLGSLGILFGIIILALVRDTSSTWLLYVYAISFGLSMGIMGPAGAAAYGDIFQGRNLGIIIGFIDIGFGIGGAIGPWLAGYIFDLTGSYDLALVMLSVAAAACCITMWFVAPRKVRLVAGKTPKAFII